jgi:hypothetical protein
MGCAGGRDGRGGEGQSERARVWVCACVSGGCVGAAAIRGGGRGVRECLCVREGHLFFCFGALPASRTAYLNGHCCWWGLREAGGWLCSCVGWV